MSVEQSFEVKGRVQGVMFRQTIIRACQKREFECGATNDPKDKNLVHLTVIGEREKVDQFIDDLMQTRPLNSWKAEVHEVKKIDRVIPLSEHEVTTKNVDEFKWSPGVEFYV